MFVKPLHSHVPDPERGGYLATAGRSVEANAYWMRRINDRDVVEAEPPPDDPAPDGVPEPTQSPPAAGSSVSEAPAPQPRTARKGA